MFPMPITQKQIQKLKQIYLRKYNEQISDEVAEDIITRLVNVIIIIDDNE